MHSRLSPGHDGDALYLARQYREQLSATQCYVADLDALTGGRRQLELLARLAKSAEGFGDGLMVDSAVSELSGARSVLATGARTLVVALETLADRPALVELLAELGSERLLVSLDLRAGRLIVPANGEWTRYPDPVELAAQLVALGVTRLLVLDLALVGQDAGPPFDVIHDIRARLPDIELLAGGGVRSLPDLERLDSLGVRGALVATALHDGRLHHYIARR